VWGAGVPDLGSYFDHATRQPVDDIAVYLQEDSDFLDTQVTTATVKFNYTFTDKLRMHYVTCYGTTDNGYVTTGAHGKVVDPVDYTVIVKVTWIAGGIVFSRRDICTV